MSFYATYLGSSGWILNFGGFRILVDPWIKGKLTFPPGSWLIEGTLEKDLEIHDEINCILLTQGLADHAHVPSLQELPQTIPVIGSSSAFDVAKAVGFKEIRSLNPGDEITINDISIKATAGARVPGLENGYLIFSNYGSLYIEPHGFLDPEIPPTNIDTVITPVIDLNLPLAGSFIKGKTVLPELIKRFNPLNILASTTGGDAQFKGLLNSLIKTNGSTKCAADLIGRKRTFIDPMPGIAYNLKKR